MAKSISPVGTNLFSPCKMANFNLSHRGLRYEFELIFFCFYFWCGWHLARVVLAPMTRCRAIDEISGPALTDYYK
ncbi:hypothetical protein F8388_024908 [Cannabis sativa]|uniref:Uncharacterized protein n=1 Tax=Cannabis sativa TaxID=3483 RepID=A0A7J6H718_CANSA|nr:hypothetical protein F8388_024908 [Cannabis sativa]